VEARKRPSRRVLVIDPNADSRQALHALVELWGHAAEVATTAADAWALLQWRPDVIVFELALPDMSGCDLATAIRRTRRGAVIRLVAYTGPAGAGLELRARAADIDLYLLKPVDPEVLRRGIEGAAPQRRLGRV
jgi:two-component system CheB/CheR fusion protein